MPSKKWSIVILGAIGAAAVVLSYTLFLATAIIFLSIPLAFIRPMATLDFGAIVIGGAFSALGLIMGGTILWSLVPRREVFEPPGVLIDLSREVRLASEIESVAAALNEKTPSQVYLIPDANAFVAQPRGLKGPGNSRIMALGLPLLQVLSVSELRAILAHEFAHFYAGDTRLAPWVYRARISMIRVFENLNKKSEIISVLTRFLIIAVVYLLLMGGLQLYWKFFMWLMLLISRRQEYRCDELACHVAGSEPLIEALKKLRKSSALLGSYWSSVVLPVATGGYQPQIADGFARFLAEARNAKAVSEYLEREIQSTVSNALDTHPPLGGRIAKARAIGIPSHEPNDRPAVTLIDNLDCLEASLLRKLVPSLEAVKMKPMHWETAGIDVYVPLWREQISAFLPLLSQETLATLPELTSGSRQLSSKIPSPPGWLLNKEQRDGQAAGLLAHALSLSLFDKGWSIHIQPGTFYMQRENLRLEPWSVVSRLQSRQLSAVEWQGYCAKAQISDWPLARLDPVAAVQGVPPPPPTSQ